MSVSLCDDSALRLRDTLLQVKSSFKCALRARIKHGSLIEAIKLLRQYVGLDENGNLRMGLREAKDICDGLKAEMNRPVANEWRP